MKKILEINTIGLGYEGISSVIYNYISNMDLSDIQVDFVAYNNTDPGIVAKFQKLGGIKYLPTRKNNTKKYITSLKELLKENYDIVHIHGNSGTMLIEVLLAKICGVKKIITHGHNTTGNYPFLHKILRIPMVRLTDEKLACSEPSGKWMYHNGIFKTLNNAIGIEAFQFNNCINTEVKKEWSAGDIFLIGHIGHFTEQKNHDFLIDIFNEYLKINSDSKLMLVSDGPKFKEIKEKVKSLGIEDKVIFTGRRNDVDRLYNAMDLFLFPSKWEGLPLTLLEAQTNGLPIIASDAITEDVKCTDRVVFKSINDSPAAWARKIEEMRLANYDRNEDMSGYLREHGFDIKTEADKLRKIYLGE